MFQIFLASFFLLLLQELLQWGLLLLHRDPPPTKSPALSILVCARDERSELERNLPLIVASMRDGDELIVVDDGSKDGSFEMLKGKWPDWPLVLVRNHRPQGKKKAVALGAAKATHSWILQTDADCTPRSKDWADRMRGGTKDGKELVLGWGPLVDGKGLLGSFLEWESIRTAMQYSLFAKIGLPYMGVGRNLLHKKALRTESKMPASYHRTLSGDDDLFVAYTAKKGMVAALLHPDSHTVSRPAPSLNAYWHQRRRHAESGVHYPFVMKAVLGLLQIAELIFFGLGIALLFDEGYWAFSLSSMGILILLRIFTSFTLTHSFARGVLFFLIPVFCFMSLMKFIFVDTSVLLSKPTRWR